MIDTRNVGQELQEQVLDAARKGRERVTSTVKTVTATAQHIRPQLANLPKPNLTRPTLPTPAQLRDKAPALAAKLPKPRQLMSGAQDLAGHARSVQRIVIEQVRSVTVPLAHATAPLAQQAATRLAQVGAQPPQPRTSTRVSGVQVSSAAAAKDDAATSKSGRTTTGRTTTTQQKAKPKAKPTAK
jgi:hypothetical protein